MISIEQILVGIGIILLLSVFASKASERYGIPALLLFLFLGMLAGSEGPGGIHFDNPWLSQALGVTALAFILFAGGVDTHWAEVRAVPAWIMLGYWFFIQFASGLVTFGGGMGGVAFWAHVGGFVAGLALVNLFTRRDYIEAHRAANWRPRRVWRNG